MTARRHRRRSFVRLDAPHRWLGGLLVLAGALSTTLILLPPLRWQDFDALPVAIAALGLGVFVTTRRALSDRRLNVLLAVATFLIALALVLVDEPVVTVAISVFFLWIALFAGAFLSVLALRVHLALIAVVYVVLVLLTVPVQRVTVVLALVIGATVTAEGFAGLTRTLRRTIATEAEARAALAVSEEQFRVLAEQSPFPIFSARVDGTYDYVNPAFCRLFGVTRTVATGPAWRVPMGPLDEEVARRAWASALAGGDEADFEVTVRVQGRGERHLQVQSARTSSSGQARFVGSLLDLTEQRELEARLTHDATHDSLTGLPNRTLLADRLDHALNRSARLRQVVGVLFVDLDRFKDVNDRYGHPAGDQVLVTVADRLRSAVRNGDTVARVGGDEFVVLLDPPVRDIEADTVANRIARIVRVPIEVANGEQVTIAASVGVAVGDARCRPDELLQTADHAMYEAKAVGRGGVRRLEPPRLGGAFSLPPPPTAAHPAHVDEHDLGPAFDALPLPLLLIDPTDGSIVAANAAACTFYGWTQAELEQRRIADINTAPAERVTNAVAQIAANERGHFRMRHRLADGTVCAVDVFAGPVVVGGRRLNLAAVLDAGAERDGLGAH